VDKNPDDPKAVTEMKEDAELWRRSRLRQVKYLNNIVEQNHRRIKRLIRPGLGFGGFWTARRTPAGMEAMAMIRKGQIRNIRGDDIRAQRIFIAGCSRWLPEPWPPQAKHGPPQTLQQNRGWCWPRDVS
jgi:hypothetical protein